MRGRSLARFVAAAQVAGLAVALIAPAAVAAATLDFTLGAPSVSTLQYSDLVTFRGTYTCINDVVSNCPTTASSQSATFSLRPSGGSTFTTVASVSTSVVFTSNPSGCPSTCSVPFQVVWRAGRAGAVTIPPGIYDLRLTTTIAPGELISLGGLTITSEDTQTTYTGAVSGVGGSPMALNASVVDLDRGLSPGTGIITPDVNLGGAAMVSFVLYDSTNTTLVAGPVSATLLPSGVTINGSTLTPPTSGGSFRMRTTYAGNGFYLTSSDLDVITVAPSNTPPVLEFPGSTVVAEATSSAGADVSYVASATDAEDNPDPTPTCSPASGSTFALGDTTVSCSVTDTGGLTTTGSFTVRVRDTTAPSVSISTTEAAGDSGWYNVASNDANPGLTVDVSDGDLVGLASLTCTDNGVDVGSLVPAGDSFVLGDGSHALACTARDAAGNTAGATASYQVDQTPPSISGAVSPTTSGTGWWNASTGAPTVTWTCGDAGSGLASCSDPSVFGEGADLAASGTAVDAAGNAATANVSGIDVDLTAPGPILFVGGLVDGASYDFGSVPAAPTCTAADGGSGLASCAVSGYSAVVGSWTLSALASDVAGNVSGSTLGYSVLPWTLTGFDKPLDMAGLNDLKAGNSAQLKFSVNAGSTDLSSVVVVAGVTQEQVACPLVAKGPNGHGGPSGGSPARKTGTPFNVRWDSPSLPGTCWQVTLRTADGSSLSVAFRLK